MSVSSDLTEYFDAAGALDEVSTHTSEGHFFDAVEKRSNSGSSKSARSNSDPAMLFGTPPSSSSGSGRVPEVSGGNGAASDGSPDEPLSSNGPSKVNPGARSISSEAFLGSKKVSLISSLFRSIDSADGDSRSRDSPSPALLDDDAGSRSLGTDEIIANLLTRDTEGSGFNFQTNRGSDVGSGDATGLGYRGSGGQGGSGGGSGGGLSVEIPVRRKMKVTAENVFRLLFGLQEGELAVPVQAIVSSQNTSSSTSSSRSPAGTGAAGGGSSGSGGGGGGGGVNAFATKRPSNKSDLTSVNADDSRHGLSTLPDKVKLVSRFPSPQPSLLSNTRQIQSLNQHDGAIWTAKFSPDGQYLCTAGQDSRVVVWAVGFHSSGNTGDFGFEEGSHHASTAHGSPPLNSPSRGGERDAGRGWRGGGASGSGRGSGSGGGSGNGSGGRGGRGSRDSVCSTDAQAPSSSTSAGATPFPFINPEPLRIFAGHTADVIDVSWSKSLFVLSASIDKTVRLWHVSRFDCLQIFRHPDLVTSVDFHPLQDRFFISGCFDKKLRVWDIIPDGVVKSWAQGPEIITSVCFSPDGATVVGGLINGQVYFYDYEGMRYITQMFSRNKGGHYAAGRKVTGISFLQRDGIEKSSSSSGNNGGSGSSGRASVSGGGGGMSGAASASSSAGATSSVTGAGGTSRTDEGSAFGASPRESIGASALQTGSTLDPADGAGGAVGGHNSGGRRKFGFMQAQLLVTTNDHRIRLFKLDNYALHCKYKGLRNSSMQIRASSSEDGRYVICGSDNGFVHVWSTGRNPSHFLFLFRGKETRNELCESFSATGSEDCPLTCAQFAPSSSLIALAKSHPELGSPDNIDSCLQCMQTQQNAPVLPSSALSDGGSDTDLFGLGTRVIVTSDYHGRIKVYARGLRQA